MSVKYGRGYKGLATKLHSLLVIEMRRKCERCGKEAPDNDCNHLLVRPYCESCQARRKRNTFQCAHIISRTLTNTRTRLDNAYCYCGGCHRYTTIHPVEFGRFVFRYSGKQTYLDLKKLSEQPSADFDWAAEYERLAQIADRENLDHHHHMKRAAKKCKKSTRRKPRKG